MKSSARKIYYSIPPAWRFLARRLYYLPLDTWETVTGKRGELTPPRGMIFTGGGDFRKTGETLLQYFKTYCKLKPESKVLDVGSGIGRVAIPLTGFLQNGGSYHGFDVVERGVKWCQEQLSSRFSNFHFQYIPLNQFDLVVVNSVFTHMVPKEVDHYFSEIHRVLTPGGVCYCTFFIYDEKEPPAFPKGFDFPFDHGHYRLMDESVKSANVAFEKSYLLDNLATHYNFSIRHLFPGSWRGLPKADCKEFQDVLVMEKVKK